MKGDFVRKVKKGVALIVSVALVFGATPAVPIYAEAEEVSANDNEKTLKDINLGVIDKSILGSDVDESSVIFSALDDFNKKVSFPGEQLKEAELNVSTNWRFTVKKSDKSMEASVDGGKITLVEGYESKLDYPAHMIKVKHNSAADVLSDANQISAIIVSECNEIMYYGNIGQFSSFTSDYSVFFMPEGLTKGVYKLYVFAEQINDNSDVSSIKDYSSALGEPIIVEVLPSVKFDITGIEDYEAGKTPDTSAVLTIEKDGVVTDKRDVKVVWKDVDDNVVDGVFADNKLYKAYISLEETGPFFYGPGTVIQVNGKDAQYELSTESMLTIVYDKYSDANGNEVSVMVKVDGSSIKLTADINIVSPAAINEQFEYKWYRGISQDNLDQNIECGMEYVLTDDDMGNYIGLTVSSSYGYKIVSTPVKIKEGILKVDEIQGVKAYDETKSGKSDGSITGFTSAVEYAKDLNGEYVSCTGDSITGLSSGTYYIRVKGNITCPKGVTGISAVYTIGQGEFVNVSFDSMGGSAVDGQKGLSYNDTVKKPKEPVKAGYIFEGWYRDKTCLIKWDFDKDRAEDDLVLYAKWTKETLNTYLPVYPVVTPTVEPADTSVPIKEPIQTFSPEPTAEPVQTPSLEPSSKPSMVPTVEPTVVPTLIPSQEPDKIQEGEKTVLKNIEYKNTGSNTVAISGEQISTDKDGNKNITIPATVTIGGNKYNVTEISDNAFSGSDIKTITLGKNVETVGKGAFKNCGSLKNVKFSSNVKKIGEESFANCKKLSKVSLPSSVKSIGKKAFKDCKSLKKITIGTVKKENSSTKSNRKLSLRNGSNDVILEYSVDTKNLLGAAKSAKVTIGASALENCINLRSVIINSQVTKIGNSTFRNCVKLNSILVKSLKLKKVGNKALKGVNNCKISVPAVKIKPYTSLFKNKGQGKKVVIAKS